jgi:Domain of unknown function (DUF4209)
MNLSQQALTEKLSELEKLSNISEDDFFSELSKLRDYWEKENTCCEEIKHEIKAFSFIENFSKDKDKDKDRWNPYFGPSLTFISSDSENPVLQLVTEEIIIYWSNRADSTENPIMKARYSGLVWELAEKITGQKPSYKVAIIYCNSLLKIADTRIHSEKWDVVEKLRYALSISISLRNKVLIENAKKSICNYEDFVSEDLESHHLGFSFDLLVLNKNVALSDEEEKEIIKKLESRLYAFKDNDPWICEDSAERLAKYYRAKKSDDEFGRVMRIWEDSFEIAASKKDPQSASSLLEHIYHIYTKFNLLDEAKRILKRIHHIAPEVRDRMIPFRYQMTISNDELELYVSEILCGNFEEDILRIISYYIPRREEAKKNLYDSAKEFPIAFLLPRKIIDNEGRFIATIGSLEKDPDGHISQSIGEILNLNSFFLDMVFRGFFEKHKISVELLVEYLYRSPVFLTIKKEFLLSGIGQYLDGNYLIATHLLIPQIEAAIRKLMEISGGEVLKPARSGGFHLRTLDEILRDKPIVELLGESISLYLRVILTDQRGWNVRNNICHGISFPQDCSKYVADRLIHILLLLAQYRYTKDDEDERE